MYVIAQDENKEMVDTFGNALSPVQYTIVNKTNQPAPMFPGDPAPPKRCTELAAAESAGAAAGEACTADVHCQGGHYCKSGICRKTPSCEANADCDSNKCESGLCVMTEEFASAGGFNRWMVGINIALDTWISSAAKNVCGGNNAANGQYSCYNAGSTKYDISNDPGQTNIIPMADPNWGGNVKTTVLPATIRALASVNYALTPSVTVGGRLGMVISGGGPATLHYDQGYPRQNKNFMPEHVELRGAYWFTPLNLPGLHPYAGVGVGVAEVDAVVKLTAYYQSPVDESGKPCPGNLCPRKLDAWRKLGRTFAAINFGGLYSLAKHHGIQLNVNAMYMMPSSGIVLEPSLGYVVGF